MACAAGAVRLFEDGFCKGLQTNLKLAKEQLIILAGHHQPWHEHDTRLMCLTLRTLYGMGNTTCLGVVVDSQPAESTASMREILDEVGLHHVNVLEASTETPAEQHIRSAILTS